MFTLGSIHEGTIVNFLDKGATIALPYGIEGFASINNLQKEDGSTAVADEKLNFKVVEFSKSNKKISLSHTKTWEDPKKEEAVKAHKSETDNTQKAVKKLKTNLEKTTLGDISELADLKERMVKDSQE